MEKGKQLKYFQRVKMEGQYQCECCQVYTFTSVCNIWYKWEVCLGRKYPLELVVASECSGALFLCPAVGSRDMSGSADVPKWFSCCKPSDTHWKRRLKLRPKGKISPFAQRAILTATSSRRITAARLFAKSTDGEHQRHNPALLTALFPPVYSLFCCWL